MTPIFYAIIFYGNRKFSLKSPEFRNSLENFHPLAYRIMLIYHIEYGRFTLILPLFLSSKCCLLLTSVAKIQVIFRKDVLMEANKMNPDQTAPKGEQSDLGSYCLQYMLLKNIYKQKIRGAGNKRSRRLDELTMRGSDDKSTQQKSYCLVKP